MRALQPPFVDLTQKIVRSGSASITFERNSAKFMIFGGICFILMGSVYAFEGRRPLFGVLYSVLGVANIVLSLRRLHLARKRVGTMANGELT